MRSSFCSSGGSHVVGVSCGVGARDHESVLPPQQQEVGVVPRVPLALGERGSRTNVLSQQREVDVQAGLGVPLDNRHPEALVLQAVEQYEPLRQQPPQMQQSLSSSRTESSSNRPNPTTGCPADELLASPHLHPRRSTRRQS
jgi:hypothetical protein